MASPRAAGILTNAVQPIKHRSGWGARVVLHLASRVRCGSHTSKSVVPAAGSVVPAASGGKTPGALWPGASAQRNS
jgi:hypothetical protein